MAGARRKTTIEERREIVKYCIEHNRNYKETANIYDVSYSQVYSWVKKYDANGEEALTGCANNSEFQEHLTINGCIGKLRSVSWKMYSLQDLSKNTMNDLITF